MTNRKGYISEAFRWSTATELELAKVLASGIGMTGPVLVAAAMGHLPAGLAAAVGALLVGGVSPGSSFKAQTKALVEALAPAAIVVIVAALLAGYGWRTDAAVVLLVCAAATIGTYSRSMIAATTRFILFLIIIISFADVTVNRPGFLVFLTAGALFTVTLNLIFGGLVRAHRRVDQSATAIATTTPTAAKKLARWKKTLKQVSGWQYALRLALCLGAASGLRFLWPNHHLYWVALTVVLLSQRKIERLPVKTTQRALGTALGVIVASLIVANRPSDWLIVVGFGLLACIRPILRIRNYLAYSAVMTPLVILMMDAGHSVEMSVVVDRLVATLLGATLVIATNFLFTEILDKNP